MLTGTGLVFIGAAMDNYIRAFDIDTGAEIWKRRLPAGGQATPMTFRLAQDQPQMVVIAAGGHGRMGSKLGDYVVAFKLRSPNIAITLWVLRSLLAILLILAVHQYLFPSQSSQEATPTRLARWRRHGLGILAFITLLTAVGLVLPGFVPSQHWLVSISAVILVAILTLVVLRSITTGRAKSLAVAGGLLVLAGVVAYWEMGELFWIGVLPM